MKALEWVTLFQEQERHHGKRVFTLSELANASGGPVDVTRVALHRLLKRGIVIRVRRGLYGMKGIAEAFDAVPALDPTAYITGHTALFHNGLVTQAPSAVTCFTRRRYRQPMVATPLGSLVFFHASLRVYRHPGAPMAGAEQALCDFAYAARMRGADPGALVTFRNLKRLDLETIRGELARFPDSVRRTVRAIVGFHRGLNPSM
jgi:hypothetical protein